jgi:cyclophilin family peptidyl-prolyl cis-trans isomerase
VYESKCKKNHERNLGVVIVFILEIRNLKSALFGFYPKGKRFIMSAFMKLRIIFILAAFAISINAQTKPVTKRNSRPAAKPVRAVVVEPFEKATVAEMSEQCVRIETESGNIELEFFPEFSPETVRNFLQLSAKGFYNGTTFTRIVPNFVIQGGNNSSRKIRTPEFDKLAEKRLVDEPSVVKHERGIISMAKTDEPNSASTHFFILVSKAGNLDGTFSAFGRVINGMEVVDAINKTPVENEAPLKPVRLVKALVSKCGLTSTVSK